MVALRTMKLRFIKLNTMPADAFKIISGKFKSREKTSKIFAASLKRRLGSLMHTTNFVYSSTFVIPSIDDMHVSFFFFAKDIIGR